MAASKAQGLETGKSRAAGSNATSQSQNWKSVAQNWPRQRSVHHGKVVDSSSYRRPSTRKVAAYRCEPWVSKERWTLEIRNHCPERRNRTIAYAKLHLALITSGNVLQLLDELRMLLIEGADNARLLPLEAGQRELQVACMSLSRRPKHGQFQGFVKQGPLTTCLSTHAMWRCVTLPGMQAKHRQASDRSL